MWVDLQVRHLLALRAVAEEGTFSAAAARLGFSQSAVSQQIGSLEKIVGHRLVERSAGPQPSALTTMGRVVLDHADTVLECIVAAEHEVSRFAAGLTGRLRVGTFQSVATRLLPIALQQMRSESPDVEVELVEEDMDLDLRLGMLDRGEIDLTFVESDVDDRFEIDVLGEDPHVLVAPRDFPEGPLDLHLLADHPMVGEPPGGACGLHAVQTLERYGVTPRYVFRSHDNGTLQRMVSAGIGVAIMALLSVDQSDDSIVIRSTTPPIPPRTLALAWKRGADLPASAARFREIMHDVCRQELAGVPVG